MNSCSSSDSSTELQLDLTTESLEMHLFDFIRRMRNSESTPFSAEAFIRGHSQKPAVVQRFKPSKISTATLRARQILLGLNLTSN